MTGSTTQETAVRHRIELIGAAIGAKELDSLRRLYAKDVISFDVEPPLQHVGIEAKLANWEKVFTVFREVRYELRELTVAVGGDVAFAHGFGRLSGTLTNGVEAGGMWVRATFCLRELGGEWLIVHDQVSVPFDMATGRGVADLEP